MAMGYQRLRMEERVRIGTSATVSTRHCQGPAWATSPDFPVWYCLRGVRVDRCAAVGAHEADCPNHPRRAVAVSAHVCL